jgi:hypothetical protein
MVSVKRQRSVYVWKAQKTVYRRQVLETSEVSLDSRQCIVEKFQQFSCYRHHIYLKIAMS